LTAQVGESSDPQTAATLRFALKLVDARCQVSDVDMQAARDVGFEDESAIDILAHVALNLFTNYTNIAIEVPVDFPPVRLSRAA
jgi:alkylhydroperoxidase family enzyme